MEFLWKQPVKNLEFDTDAFEDLAWWIENDRKKALKVIKLIREAQRNPFEGTGQPEALKHDLSGCWSRRIDQEHRLVYEVLDDKIRILACRFHY
ncbi:MAG: Txe/YoeB family addiction module toxin [Pseudanabaena sp. CAN_BIN31]|nr:Txe/YoeB family addiction module toxin [Pseudanabaena sp. CAN_BIN31]